MSPRESFRVAFRDKSVQRVERPNVRTSYCGSPRGFKTQHQIAATVVSGALTALLSKHSTRCHMTTEVQDDQRTLSEREIWRKRCEQQDTSRGMEEDGGGSTDQSSRWTRVVCVLCSTH